MSNKRGLVLMISGCIFLLGATALFLYNDWKNREALNISRNTVEIIHNEVKNKEENSQGILNYNNMDVIAVGNNKYIGTLSIPTLQLDLPVEDDWSYAKLKTSPCRYKGNLYDGSLIIIAHNYESHFGRIGNLESGEKISFTDAKGHTYNFAVAEVTKLDGTAVEEMERGNWDLTLFTCTYGGKQRVTVRCIRI